MNSSQAFPRWFASDNHASVHPNILQALAKANQGHAYAYGSDPITEAALKKFKKLFGPKSETYFVFNGTAANVLSLKSLLRTHEAVLCAEGAHVAGDECGALEALVGSKLLVIPSDDGKLKLDKIDSYLNRRGDQHSVQARAVTITQSTEWGTLYKPDELKEIRKLKIKQGLFLHMDGARFANACAALDIHPRKMVELAGVDVLSFGGTKNGCFMAEAVVFPNYKLANTFKYVRKQGMQLSSKMRYVSAQFLAYLEDDLWLKNARHSNAMAKYMAEQLTFVPGLEFVQKPEVNALFVKIPKEWNKNLLLKTHFYVWDESLNILRLMTSWDTQRKEIDFLVSLLNAKK